LSQVNITDRILNHSIAGPFYRQHAGAFLFLFFILFGIQPSIHDALRTHYAFINGVLTSINFFFVALAWWILYGLKTILFFRSCLQKDAYDFLYHLNAIPAGKRLPHLLKLSVILLAPISGYTILIIGVAIKERLIPTGALVVATVILLHLLTSFVMYYLLEKAKGLQQVKRYRFFFSLPKNLFGFLLKFIFYRQFLALLLVKTISFSCLYFFVRTDASIFEERMLWLLFITMLIAHSIIVFRNFHFLENQLFFYRNLPIPDLSILMYLLGVYIVLLLPEAWALRALMINHEKPGEYVWMILTGPFLLLLLHSLLFTEDMKMEEFLKLLFGVWVVFVFFSLSRNHWIPPLVGFVFAPIIFLMSYHRYEKNTDIEGLE